MFASTVPVKTAWMALAIATVIGPLPVVAVAAALVIGAWLRARRPRRRER